MTMSLLRRFVVISVLLMLGAHILVLMLSDQSAISTPISQLSRAQGAGLHTAGLIGLALANAALALLLSRVAVPSRVWSISVWLMALNGAFLVFIAVYFLLAPQAQLFGLDANDPLVVLASNVGVIMGLLYRDLRRCAPRLALGNGLLFALWLALIPVIPFIDAEWLGAYERTVGSILLLWLTLLALGLPAADKPA